MQVLLGFHQTQNYSSIRTVCLRFPWLSSSMSDGLPFISAGVSWPATVISRSLGNAVETIFGGARAGAEAMGRLVWAIIGCTSTQQLHG